MECAILASTPAMAASLRRVLDGLHSQKHQPGVDKMLLELYEPILFRRLSAANPDVRRNALQLLVDAFPLRVGGLGWGSVKTAPWEGNQCNAGMSCPCALGYSKENAKPSSLGS